MKKSLLLILLALVMVLGACGGKTESKKKISTEEVIQSFKDAKLEVGDVTEMDKKEFGETRKEGKRILIPSLGDDAGGRLMRFGSEKDLEKAKKYYVDLGKSGPIFFSHTHQSGLFLLQMNGDMEDAKFDKYAATLEKVVTGSTDIEVTEESKVNTAENLTEAQVGDIVEDSFAGTYTIDTSYESPTDKFKSADVEFTIEGIKTAKLVAEDPDLIQTSKETNVLILSITGENLSDDTVSFHPNTATMITDTKRQIESNVMISPFESEFIGKVIQKGEVIFDLGEEGLEGITELKFVFDGTAKDASKIGDEVTVVVSITEM